jgi:hypothetical protein
MPNLDGRDQGFDQPFNKALKKKKPYGAWSGSPDHATEQRKK